MAKYNSIDAFNSRLCDLALTKKTILKETRNSGTLIDYKRNADGIAYGIIKENHNYYIKKGSKKENLDSSDFSYIGGLENIKMYQFGSISEAERQRNVMFSFVNGVHNLSTNKSTTKLINEGAGDDIKAASDSVNDLDAATAAKEKNPVVPDLTDTQPIPDSDMGVDPDMGGDMPTDDMGAEPDMGGDDMGDVSDENKEIQKLVGKVTEKIRNSNMTEPEVKSFINSYLSAFKDKLPEIEIEDRKEMANKILKVVDQGEIDDLENIMPSDEVAEGCSECGSFTQFAESRGYDKDSFANASNDEKTSVISGYVNAHNDGKNDGDAKSVALYADDDIVEALDKEYGHNKYVSEILKPEMMKMSENTDEDKQLKINELSWGGIKNAASAVGSGLKSVGNAAASGLKNAYTGTVDKAKEVGGNIAKQYNTGVRDDRVNQVNKLAQELKTKIDVLNAASAKIGGKQIDMNQALDLIKKQLAGVPSNIQGNSGATAAYNLGKNNTIKGAVRENPVDAGNTEVREMIHEDDEELDTDIDNLDLDDVTPESDEIEAVEPEIDFAPTQSLGMVGGSLGTTGVDVNVDGNNKTVNIKMNENAGKFPNGHAPVSKSTIAAKPTSMSTPTTNLKGVEKVAKKTEGHVMTTNGKIATKPVKTEMIKEEDEPNTDLTSKAKSKKEVVEISESEKKLRLYIRRRLEEKTGKRKPSLNESVKSDKLKQLDKLIDQQLLNYKK